MSRNEQTPHGDGAETRITGATGNTSLSRAQHVMEALPGPIRFIVQLLLMDWVEDEDGFTQVLRKIVVTAGLCMFIHPVSYIGYFVYLITQGAPKGGPIALIVACCFSMFSWSALYFVCRAFRAVPDVLLDCWLVGTNVAFTLLVLSMPEYPATTCVMASAILTVLCNSPRRALFLAWCAVLYLLEQYNNSALGTDYELLVPGPRRGPFAERLVHHMSGFFIAATVLIALLMQTREHVRHVDAANHSVETAQKMARLLARYDTVAVDRLINRELNKDNSESALFEAFGNIAENLEKYRPHLPNWMLNQALEESEEMDPDLASLSTLGSMRSSASKADSTMRDFAKQRSGAINSSGNFSGGSAASPFSSGGALNASSKETDAAIGFAAQADIPDDTSSMLSDSSSVHQQRQQLRRQIGGPLGDSLFQGKAAVGVICVAPQPTFDTARATPVYTSVVDTFVSEVLECAQATGAALHAFVGDKLQLSWNATHRVPQPEIKVCRFFAQLRQKINANDLRSTLILAGAGVCCDTICRFAGPASGQRTLHLSLPEAWQVIQNTIVGFACATNAFLVDGWTARAAKHEIVMRDVEALNVDWNTESLPMFDRPVGFELPEKAADEAVLNTSSAHDDTVENPRSGPSSKHGSPSVMSQPIAVPSLLNLPPRVSPTALQGRSPAAHGLAATRGSGKGSPAANAAAQQAPSAPKKRVVVVSEVLSERSNKHDEWMYVLEANDSADDANSAVTTALRLAVSGRFPDAASQLSALDKANDESQEASPEKKLTESVKQTVDAPLVRRLHTRVLDALRKSNGLAVPQSHCEFPITVRHPAQQFALTADE